MARSAARARAPRPAAAGVARPAAGSWWFVGPGLGLGLLLLPLALTWPLALHLATRFPGDHPTDALIHTRQLWWMGRAAGSLANPYVSPIILYPQGARLYFETLVPLDGLLASIPLRLFGPLAAYNLVVLLALGLSGLAAAALARRLTGSRAAGALAGLVYAASPYLMNHLRAGHIGVVTALWTPLALLALLALLARNERRWLLAAGVFLAAAAYTDLQSALSLALLATLLLAREALLRPRGLPRAAALFAAAGALALALAAPLLLGILGEVRGGADVTPPLRQAIRNSADLLAFIGPQPLHPLWGAVMQRWYAGLAPDALDEAVVSPGLVVLALAAIGLLTRATRQPFWALAALLFALLALGPRVQVGGQAAALELPFGLPTPYALLMQAPFVGIGRTPARFMGPAMLCLALLAGWGMLAVRARLPARAGLVAPLAALLVLAEFLPAPFPLAEPHVPAAYRALAERGCRGPVLELPVDANSADQKARMYFQALHGCAISGGYTARGGDETRLGSDWRKAARQDDPHSDRARALAESVRAAAFQYVVVWNPAYESDAERERDARLVSALFPEPPIYRDDESALYLLVP